MLSSMRFLHQSIRLITRAWAVVDQCPLNLLCVLAVEDTEVICAEHGQAPTVGLGAQVVIDRETGRSKGYGFVKFDDTRDASDAIASCHGKVLIAQQSCAPHRKSCDMRLCWNASNEGNPGSPPVD